MILVVTTIALGALLGYLFGGRLERLAHVDFAGVWLVGVAVALQIVLAVLARLDLGGSGYPLLLASHLALLAFMARNRQLPGMPLLFVGFLLNAVVIAANGAMPVDPEALAAVSSEPVADIPPGKHRLLEDSDRLGFLADVVPLRPLRTVVSVGDIVMAAGAAVFMVGAMRRDAPAPSR